MPGRATAAGNPPNPQHPQGHLLLSHRGGDRVDGRSRCHPQLDPEQRRRTVAARRRPGGRARRPPAAPASGSAPSRSAAPGRAAALASMQARIMLMAGLLPMDPVRCHPTPGTMTVRPAPAGPERTAGMRNLFVCCSQDRLDWQSGAGPGGTAMHRQRSRLRRHQPTAGPAHVHAASAQQDATPAKVPRRTGRRTHSAAGGTGYGAPTTSVGITAPRSLPDRGRGRYRSPPGKRRPRPRRRTARYAHKPSCDWSATCTPGPWTWAEATVTRSWPSWSSPVSAVATRSPLSWPAAVAWSYWTWIRTTRCAPVQVLQPPTLASHRRRIPTHARRRRTG